MKDHPGNADGPALQGGPISGDEAVVIVPRTPDGSEQLALLPATVPPPRNAFDGLQQAIDNADPWELDGAIRLVEALAAQRVEPIHADLIRAELGDPTNCNSMGAVFRVARSLGVIEPVGAAPSGRAQRHGGLRRHWRATESYLASLENNR